MRRILLALAVLLAAAAPAAAQSSLAPGDTFRFRGVSLVLAPGHAWEQVPTQGQDVQVRGETDGGLIFVGVLPLDGPGVVFNVDRGEMLDVMTSAEGGEFTGATDVVRRPDEAPAPAGMLARGWRLTGRMGAREMRGWMRYHVTADGPMRMVMLAALRYDGSDPFEDAEMQAMFASLAFDAEAARAQDAAKPAGR
jgi:hypothetical protein